MNLVFLVVIRRLPLLKKSSGSRTASASFAGIFLLISLQADGVPSFWLWLSFIGTVNVFSVLLTPTCYSLGLEPMGELAGTASAVMGFMSTAAGAGLAAIIDAQIDMTVTPMAAGYVGYGLLTIVFLRLGR